MGFSLPALVRSNVIYSRSDWRRRGSHWEEHIIKYRREIHLLWTNRAISLQSPQQIYQKKKGSIYKRTRLFLYLTNFPPAFRFPFSSTPRARSPRAKRRSKSRRGLDTDVVGGADGAEADVGPDDLGVGVLGDDLGGDAAVLGAVAAGGAGLALLLRGVDGVEPEHVGVVLGCVSGVLAH